MPYEPVCTENLTPWLKLLPCGQDLGKTTERLVSCRSPSGRREFGEYESQGSQGGDDMGVPQADLNHLESNFLKMQS